MTDKIIKRPGTVIDDPRDQRRDQTPPAGIKNQLAGPVPHEFADDPKSGVHGESTLDAIERRQRSTLSKAQTTLETLERHDKDIAELKITAADIQIETRDQSRKLDIQDAKLDTMLTILDPTAPDKIKKIVHQAIETTTFTTDREERKIKVKRQLTIIQTVGTVVVAAISAGVFGYLAHGC